MLEGGKVMSPGRVSTWRRGARVALVLLTPALLAACANQQAMERAVAAQSLLVGMPETTLLRSEEHTSELQSLMRISYAVFCLKKKKKSKKKPKGLNEKTKEEINI